MLPTERRSLLTLEFLGWAGHFGISGLGRPLADTVFGHKETEK